MSLKDLVALHGFGIKVVSNALSFKDYPFIITGECDKLFYKVRYESGASGFVLKECDKTNDYHLFS